MMLIISCGIFADNLCVFAETQPVADSSGKPDAFTDGFENGLGEWFSFGAIPIEIDNTVSRTGSNSLLATGRTIEWHGPSVNLTDKLIFGAQAVLAVYGFAGNRRDFAEIIRRDGLSLLP